MNATATPLDKRGNPTNIRFNQRVGKAMDSALKEVTKYLRVKHDTWPSGYDIEIAFEDRFTAKDGPSAAICCALLLDSLVSGKTIDPFFAVTGDMNADGSVQPVGGVPAKVRGAFSKSCKYVAIPTKNARSLSDLVLLNELILFLEYRSLPSMISMKRLKLRSLIRIKMSKHQLKNSIKFNQLFFDTKLVFSKTLKFKKNLEKFLN